MTDASPIWPAKLHHLGLASPDPEQMAAFYGDAMGMTPSSDGATRLVMRGAERRLVIERAEAPGLGFSAFALQDADHLAAVKEHLAAAEIPVDAGATPLFAPGAIASRDADGNRLVFGLPGADDGGGDGLPARLQHVVVATTRLGDMVAYYRDGLGFVISDWVREPDGEATTCFLRSDPEHHSFAAFRAGAARLDHHAYETTCWNDIRDWADQMATLHITMAWGPGRHGPGNNLVIMVRDPDDNMVELSAELEHMPRDMAPREWPHEPRTLNSWGEAIMRS